MSEASTVDVLVLDAGKRPGLVTLRELGRAGVRCCAVESEPGAPGFASRYSAHTAVVPDFAADQDGYVDALLELCASYRPSAVIPSHDGSIEALRRRRQEIELVTGLALAPPAALAVAVDKGQTLAVAAGLGLRAPRGAVVTDRAGAQGALGETGLPVVVKPARSWAQEGEAGQRLTAIVATARPEALAAIHAFLDQGADAVVQEWLPGDREALSFFHAQGRTWARFAQRADRTSPPLGGNSVKRVSIPMPPDVADAAERLVTEIGLDGYSEVEFRRDASGGAALMEINPRLSASVEIAVRSGVPFPALLYAWAAGLPLTEAPAHRTGVRMRWLGGDLQWLESAFTQPRGPDIPSRSAAVRTFAGDFARPMGYDYVARDDPRPALVAASGMARDTGRRLARIARRRQRATEGMDTDVAVIGAGPYGLSLSAHLSSRGIAHEVFGEPMDLWRDHMPAGMCLKSEGFASNLSDPAGEHTLERFCAAHGREYGHLAVPVTLDTFTRYGLWFGENLVPQLRRRRVELVRRAHRGFRLWLDDAQELRARRVVVATGLQHYPHLPDAFDGLPAGSLVHSYDHADPAEWAGRDVIVIGAGQSALEAATLIAEQGGRARLIARTSRLAWAYMPRGRARKLTSRVRDPLSGLGEGWRLLAYADHPLAFHALREPWRAAQAYTALAPCGSWWLRSRFEAQVPALLGRSIERIGADGGTVVVRTRGAGGEEELRADHVIAATGYRPDVSRLAFLDPELRSEIATTIGAPALDRGYQSSAPGVFFTGYSAAASFGPVMRFVFGTDFASRRLARRLAG